MCYIHEGAYISVSFLNDKWIKRKQHIYFHCNLILIIWLFQIQDYAMEADENQTRNSAGLMVASLAGSLAHVTCKVGEAYFNSF